MTRPTLDELRARIPWQGKYAAQPGTGPVGATCHSCAFLANTGRAGGKSHPKCGKTKYTSGDATTIRTSTAACSQYAEQS